MDVYEWVDIISANESGTVEFTASSLYEMELFFICSNLSVTATQSAHNPTELPAITLLIPHNA